MNASDVPNKLRIELQRFWNTLEEDNGSLHLHLHGWFQFKIKPVDHVEYWRSQAYEYTIMHLLKRNLVVRKWPKMAFVNGLPLACSLLAQSLHVLII